MKKKLFTLILISMAILKTNSQNITNKNDYPIYAEKDLGCNYSKLKTVIKVYAPTAYALKLNLYKTGSGNNKLQELNFEKDNNGVWKIELTGDKENLFYTVQSFINNKWSAEVTDPYAKAVGVNGNRVQIIDFEKTNPTNWNNDITPVYTLRNATQDAIIYETHLRDISVHKSSNIKQKGKYLGLTELNTTNDLKQFTGLSHIKELGVTHLHILPAFDFNSVDESKPKNVTYNWGYDPKNYNTPEGSYSTNANDASIRIKEFKQMVAALHKQGINVVMDVVYNHTAANEQSNFHQLVPGYYHRMKAENKFADASGCGNETASEMPMMRKFMIESLEHWVKEYHIDGFRFDLMAIHDIETMNEISSTLQKLKPNILLYGEGWTAGNPSYDDKKLALKKQVSQLNNISVFSDDIRDAIKGYVFDKNAKGFVNGNYSMIETIKFGIVGCMPHKQIAMEKCFYEKKPYATNPAQVITYVDCHDNLTLFDKLAESAKEASKKDRIKMQEMALGIVLTSQGIPFIHAGSEFLRSKNGVENSYNKPDKINAINWNEKNTNLSTYNFIKAIIDVRKKHSFFKLNTAEEIEKQINFLPAEEGVLAFTIKAKDQKDTWKKLLIVCNANTKNLNLETNQGIWKTAVANDKFTIENNKIDLPALSFGIFYED